MDKFVNVYFYVCQHIAYVFLKRIPGCLLIYNSILAGDVYAD